MRQIRSKIYSWLRKSEQYTQTDNVYLAKGGFWLVLNRAVAIAGSFLSAVAFANLLDPALFGNYKYIISLVGFLSIFSLKGFGAALTQAVSRGIEGGFYSLSKTRLRFACLQSLGVIALGGYYLYQSNFLLALPLFFISFILPFRSEFSLITNFLTGRKNFRLSAKYQSIQNLITNFSLIVFLLSAVFFPAKTKLIVFSLVGIYFLSETIVNGFFYIRIKKQLQPNRREDPKTKKYGYHLTIVDFLDQVAQYLDQILIFQQVGAIRLAIYTFALWPVDKLKEPIQMIATLALPKFSVKNSSELKKNLLPKIFKLLILTGAVIVFYCLIAPFIFKIFFPRYTEAIIYSRIYAISLLGIGYLLSSAALNSQMAIKKIYFLEIPAGILSILLLIAGWWWLGILGIILAKTISEIIRSVISIIMIKKL